MIGRENCIDHGQVGIGLGDDEAGTTHGRRNTNMKEYRYADVEGSFQKFSGNDKQNVMEWISMFDKMCTRSNWTEFEKLIYIRRSVTDEVYEQLIFEDDDNYDTAKKVLLKEYGGMWTQAAAVKRLMARKKGRDETTRQYMLDMRRLGRAARLNDPCVAQFILDGIDLDWKMKVALHGITDMTRLREMIERAEEYEIEMMAKVHPKQDRPVGRYDDARKKSIDSEWTNEDQFVKRSHNRQHKKREWNNALGNVVYSDGRTSCTSVQFDKSNSSEGQIIVVDVSSGRARVEDDNTIVDNTIGTGDEDAEANGIPEEDDNIDDNVEQLNNGEIAVRRSNEIMMYEGYEKETNDVCFDGRKDYCTSFATSNDEHDGQWMRDFQDEPCVAKVNEITENVPISEGYVTVTQGSSAERRCIQSNVRERWEYLIDPGESEEIEPFVDASDSGIVVTNDVGNVGVRICDGDAMMDCKNDIGEDNMAPVDDEVVMDQSEGMRNEGVIYTIGSNGMVMVERSDADTEDVCFVNARVIGERSRGHFQGELIVQPSVEGMMDTQTQNCKGQTTLHRKDLRWECTEEICGRNFDAEVIDPDEEEHVESYLDATEDGWLASVDLEASGAATTYGTGGQSGLPKDEESGLSVNWMNALGRRLYGNCEWISNSGGRGTIVC